MEKLHSKKITKYITIIAVIIMLCNFVMPNYTYAATNNANGGELHDPLVKFLVFLSDSIFQFLQESFTSMESIKEEDDDGNYVYKFQYSPGIIFSGHVPALDINFITANDVTALSTSTTSDVKKIMREYVYKKALDWYNESSKDDDKRVAYEQLDKKKYKLESGIKSVRFFKLMKYDVYYKIKGETIEFECEFSDRPFLIFWQGEKSYYSTAVTANEDEDLAALLETRQYKSTAAQLRNTIGTWYKALRRIALVGLLSVLVYIGIRILIGSPSPEKQSKYKQMLTDWLVAMCLLFTLHYLMAFIVTMVQEISALFGMGETDTLLASVRNKIEVADSWDLVIGPVILYIVLCIYTLIFTVQYIKRVIYIGFFTMIAPLVTLTYPLDKINDGKAQAFNMWMREYIFNSLLQVVHLLIYTILVSSALALVDMYPLYAIVVIGFMTQGEKLIRKMFGFETSTSVGTLQSFVAGGLITNALKSLKKATKPKGEKSDDGKDEGGSKPVRTTNNDPLAGLRAGQNGERAQTNNGTRQQTNRTNASSENSERRSASARAAEAFRNAAPAVEGSGANTRTGVANNRTGARPVSARAQEAFANNQTARQGRNNAQRRSSRIRGALALTRRYVGPALRTLGAGATAAVGGTIGFAAGVAQGDIGKALGGAAGGLAAGYYTGQRAIKGAGSLARGVAHIDRPIRNVIDTYRRGAGIEEEENSNEEE